MLIKSFEEYVENFAPFMNFQGGFTKETAPELLSKLYNGNLASLLNAHEQITGHFIEIYAEKGFSTSQDELDGKAAEKIAKFGTTEAWNYGFVPQHHWSEQFLKVSAEVPPMGDFAAIDYSA